MKGDTDTAELNMVISRAPTRPLPSRVSPLNGDTVTSNLQLQDAATNNYSPKNIHLCKHIKFFLTNICIFDFFFVILQPEPV